MRSRVLSVLTGYCREATVDSIYPSHKRGVTNVDEPKGIRVGERQHWEGVYRSKADAELSWFQSHPAVSLSLFDGLNPMPQRVIDIGGGQSALASELLARGVGAVAVLDISNAAIERARVRMGPHADQVRWIVSDVLDAVELGQYDLWHDRAVFHFLTDPEQKLRYVEIAAGAVCPGGHMIVATFAPNGPEKCSGLTVCRYDTVMLVKEFGTSFEVVSSTTEAHVTPWGKTQEFLYLVLRRI